MTSLQRTGQILSRHLVNSPLTNNVTSIACVQNAGLLGHLNYDLKLRSNSHRCHNTSHASLNGCRNDFYPDICVAIQSKSKKQIKHFCSAEFVSCNTKSRLSTLASKNGRVLSRNSLISSNILSHRHFISVSPKAILDASPPTVQPYLRLIRFDKPIGSWLLFWPCSWSIALAADPGHFPDFKMLALFGAGAFFMRGAGCIINDLYDRDFDKMEFDWLAGQSVTHGVTEKPHDHIICTMKTLQEDLRLFYLEFNSVSRTKNRPLASGELNTLKAISLLGFQLSVSLAILMQLNWYSVILGASSMGLVIAYPLAKRYTYWPQVVLGLTFNWGALLGWSAVQGSCAWGAVIPLYLSGVAWTLVYDTIYAHQDKEDDILVGVKSTALKFGDQTKYWLTGFSSLMLGNLALTGYMCDQTFPYYAAMTLVGGHLAHQIYTVDLDNADDCFTKFKANSRLGILLFFGIMCGTLTKKRSRNTQEQGNKSDSLQD